MQFLKKHARFLIVMVVMMVLLYFANTELAESSRRIDGARNTAKSVLNQNYTALFKDAKTYGGEPAVVEGRKIQDRTQNLQQVETGRNSMLAFETSAEFTISALPAEAGDDDKVQYYRNKAGEVMREFSLKRYINITDDTPLGFKADGAITAAMVPSLLRKLDIVRTVSGSVGRSRVAWLNQLTFKPAAREKIAARKVPVVDAPLDPGKVGKDEEASYLEADCLSIVVQGSEEALYNFLIDLQRPMKGDLRTRYLAVESFTFTKPDILDPADNLITATILVVAYKVNEQSPYPIDRSAPETQQPKAGQPRSFRQDR